jgi:hypothetical protein
MSATPSMPAFQRLQRQFIAHMRDPARHPAPDGLEDRRVGVYRELLYNNIQSLLAGNFPVIRRITEDSTWHALVRGFFAEHQSHTPLFPELGREFLRYLEARAERGADDPPFLYELAHYEWVEVAVTFDESRIEDIAHDPAGDVVDSVPVISPTAWPLAYRYPVQHIRPDFQPTAPSDPITCLIVARNRADEVSFMEVDVLTLKLLQTLKENPGTTGLQCLSALAAAFEPSERDAMMASGKSILRALRARDVLLGTQPS